LRHLCSFSISQSMVVWEDDRWLFCCEVYLLAPSRSCRCGRDARQSRFCSATVLQCFHFFPLAFFITRCFRSDWQRAYYHHCPLSETGVSV